MGYTRKTDRRAYLWPDSALILSPKAPRQSNTIGHTPRRIRLLCDAQATAGKMTRKELFKAQNIAEATGYRILKSKIARRSERIYNRGRKAALTPYERDAIDTVENASFRFRVSTHLAVVSLFGLANRSERAIQQNIAEHGVGICIAQRKKFIRQTSIEKRGI
jgi:hypothetical protein